MTRRVILATVVLLVATLLLAPGLAYEFWLGRIDGRPAPAPPAGLPKHVARAVWAACGERTGFEVEPLDPWTAIADLAWRDPLQARPGARAAAHLARVHLRRDRSRSNLDWHFEQLALTIWITRHWTAPELAAMLAARGVCRPHRR